MITIRFSGRRPSPEQITMGQETDSGAEKIRFLLPEIGENQVATVQMILPDGKADAVTIEDRMITVPARLAEMAGRSRAWVEILADGVAWHSEIFYLDVGELPPISERTEQEYPTAFQEAIARSEAAKRAAEIAAAIAKSAQGNVTVAINGDGDLIVTYEDTEGEETEANLGPVSAYTVAKKYGYAGTEQEWEEAIASVGEKADAAAQSAEDAAASAEEAQTGKTAALTAQAAAQAAKTAAQTAQEAAETAAARDTAAWLEENITNPDSPPLDRTLSFNTAAAPADMVGDLKSALLPIIAIGAPVIAQAGKKMTGLAIGQQYALTDDAGAQYAVMDVSAYIGGTITVKTKTIFNYNSRQTAFCNASGIIQRIWTEADLARIFFPATPDSDGYYTAIFNVEYPLFVFTYKLKDTGGNDVEITLTPNAVHVYSKTETDSQIAARIAANVDNTLSVSGKSADAKATGDALAAVREQFSQLMVPGISGAMVEGAYIGAGSDNAYTIVANANSQYCVLDVDGYAGAFVHITKNNVINNSTRKIGFCGADGKFLSGQIWTEHEMEAGGSHAYTYNSETGVYERDEEIPAGAKYFVFSCVLTDTTATIYVPGAINVYTKAETAEKIEDAVSSAETKLRNATCYVSTNGNDATGDGTIGTPFATVNKALTMGYTNILLRGGVYRQQIDLTKTTAHRIIISQADWTTKAVFEPENPVLCTSAPLVSGKTKTRSAAITPTLAAGNDWIYQDGIADAATLIDEAERMPQERGYAYRCLDTRIVRCAATSAAAAIEEIESADDYRWYQDGTTLYFSSPEAPSADHPICYSDGTALFTGNSRKYSVKCVGIETHYMSFNINQLLAAELIDCKAANMYAQGAFVYDRCLGATFRRCEAARCIYNGSTGDGFNAHSYTSNDYTSHQTSALLIDCWSHDNCDDGFSDHERCESTIIGGLFEHNGKAGITPSYGASNTCIDVYSRHNINGFAYVGEVTSAEGGKYGQMLLYGCVAESNTAPSSGGDDNCGYKVKANGNRAILVDCKSIDNACGYRTDNVSTMVLTDCGSSGDTMIKSGNVTAKNTTIVS